MNLYSLKPHPFSTIFPSATGDDYSQLVASIKKIKKLRYPIILYQNVILDGNQRIRACREARVEPPYIEFEGNDEAALELVWDLNAARRQLTASQRAMSVAKYTLFYESGHRADLCPGTQVTEKLAEKAGVSRSSVQRAKKVLCDGTEDEKKALESGEAKAKPLADKIRQREKQSDNGAAIDDMGFPVSIAALAYWNRKPEAKNVLAQISAARGQVKKLLPDDPMWSAVNLNGVIADLNSAFNRFAAAIPAFVCPYCDGENVDGCQCCKGKGAISKYMWSMIPEELRKLREIKRTFHGSIATHDGG
jgi:hypothetical protein